MCASENVERLIAGFRHGDAVARLADWDIIRSGGNITSHRLVRQGSARMVFRPSVGSKIFSWVFILIGLIVLWAWLAGDSRAGGWLFLLIGISFPVVGGWLLVSSMVIVFDKMTGRFRASPQFSWVGTTKAPFRSSGLLRDIHAIQLLSELVDDADSKPYYSYELNLVLRNGSRVAVMKSGKTDPIRTAARALSLFLGRPVWDAMTDGP